MLMARSGTAVDAIENVRAGAGACAGGCPSLGGRDLPLTYSEKSVGSWGIGGWAGPDGCRLFGITRPVLVV